MHKTSIARVADILRTNVSSLYISILPYLPPIMLVCIVCQDILLNHIPASALRAVVAAWSPEICPATHVSNQSRSYLLINQKYSKFESTYPSINQRFDNHTPILKYHRPINIKTHSPPHQEIISYFHNHKKTIIPIN
jgi:hypothetical protein